MPPLPSPTFCIVPWVRLYSDAFGNHIPCCMASEKTWQYPLNPAPGGQPYTIYHTGELAAGWQSEFMRGLRLSFLAGQQPEMCAACFRNEALGMRSYRESTNEKYGEAITDAIAATAADGSAPLDLVRCLYFQVGNLCNLRCRMCSPFSSRLMIPEWRLLFDTTKHEEVLKRFEHNDWFAHEVGWSTLERQLPRLERLHFSGGEPLISEGMFELLRQLIASRRSGRIILNYNTNLTVLPKQVTGLWPHFREVRITTSLDGMGAVNSYIRHPAQWEHIDANLKALTGNPERYNCVQLMFNTTVQAYNVLYLTDLFEDLFPRWAPGTLVYPTLSPLAWPGCFSIRVLPAPLKVLAEDRLRAFMTRWEGRWPDTGPALDWFLADIQGIIDHMHGADCVAELPEFRRRTRVFDQSRGQDIRRVMPEWAPWFKQAYVPHS